jgi:2-polyprenyl-3-methyl-5-hydroxy-6-metoxy-1,4-benzoquinol methylase
MSKEFWNKRFNTEEFVFGKEPNLFLKRVVKYIEPNSKVLCVADGEGRNSVWLAKQGFLVDAFDISDIGIDKARKYAKEQNVDVNYFVADTTKFNFEPDTYDAIIAIFIQYNDGEERDELFRNMISSLKPEGKLILQGYTRNQLKYNTGGPPQIPRLYTSELLLNYFKDLSIIQSAEYIGEMNEGNAHIGISALIEFVVKK